MTSYSDEIYTFNILTFLMLKKSDKLSYVKKYN
nr:MAG TPA: hypothetical protein [Caudoviricetes sp.]DAE93976.1 MAG TPA: hypothetical protein [Caudoviricetes sp.]DAX77999.1 MAG TPA: hypothetical protein [Caudoviricetes sp.]DAY95202.1 MAG TPA: hypothetical protein [Caudoviricetes sp.]